MKTIVKNVLLTVAIISILSIIVVEGLTNNKHGTILDKKKKFERSGDWGHTAYYFRVKDDETGKVISVYVRDVEDQEIWAGYSRGDRIVYKDYGSGGYILLRKEFSWEREG